MIWKKALSALTWEYFCYFWARASKLFIQDMINEGETIVRNYSIMYNPHKLYIYIYAERNTFKHFEFVKDQSEFNI